MICEYSKDISGNGQVELLCIKDSQTCWCYRWCSTEQRIKMTDGYVNCKKRVGENMKDNKPKQEVKVEKELISKPNTITNYEICKVVLVKNNEIYFNLSDCGLKYEFVANVGDNIKVEFESQIGKGDFKIVKVELV